MKKIVTLVFVFLTVKMLFSEQLFYEKFISSSVTVADKTYPFYIVYDDNNRPKEIFVETKDWVDKIYGYGGPIVLQIYFTFDGKINRIKVLEQYETETYAHDVFTDKFLGQYYNKSIKDKFLVGKDIKAITGATISCNAVNEIIYQCVINVNKYLFQNPQIKFVTFRPTKNEIIKSVVLSFLFCLSIVGVFVVSKFTEVLRYIVMLISIVWLGFLYYGGLSFWHVKNIINYINSPLLSNVFILTFLFITFVSTILIGRVYCGWLCPFGSITELLFQVKKFFEIKYKKSLGKEIDMINIEHNKIVRFLQNYEFCYRYIKYILAVAIIFIPVLMFFEPFQYMFVFWKTQLRELIYLSLIVVLCILFVRLWCRYCCPLGAVFAVLSKFSLFKLKIENNTCLKCEICKNVCPTNAIIERNKKLVVIHSECILCNKCRQLCGPRSIQFKLFTRK